MGEEKSNEEIENPSKRIKKGFLKKVWYSITKIEKYPEMATEGVAKALTYIFKLITILAIILSIGVLYDAHKTIIDVTNYLEDSFPEFSYRDGILKVESDEPIIIENNDLVGKIIVDTNTDSEEEIDNYIKRFGQYDSGLILIKNRVILININTRGSISYKYKDLLSNMEITEFSKDNIIKYVNSNKIYNIYISLFIVIFIYGFMMYLLRTIWYVAIISIFGYLTAWALKIKMRYAPIFNMSVYAVTLSVILNVIYLIVNLVTGFTVQYFQVMYIAVATIYLLSAIFIIKSEFIKKQSELMKIAEVQAVINKEKEAEKEEEKKEEEENKENGKEEKEKKKETGEDNNLGEEPEGSEA